jgi:hypothetical protein
MWHRLAALAMLAAPGWGSEKAAPSDLYIVSILFSDNGPQLGCILELGGSASGLARYSA